jgi:hypothetical protein
MANLTSEAQFRYVRDIHLLSDQELREHGYYRGFVCPHGHTIRDMTHHWCYHCVLKIRSNICGFDVNYMDPEYKVKYEKLWKRIRVSDINECWEIDLPGAKSPRRICMPSYRAIYTNQKSEKVNVHKAIYQAAWGDIGSMFVTRVCGNPWCGNPLHMVSTWNAGMPPKRIHPFCTKYEAEKLMLMSRARLLGKAQEVVQNQYKPTIAHPLCVKDAPDYDEG